MLDLGGITGWAKGRLRDRLPALGAWDLRPDQGDPLGGRAAILDNTLAAALDLWGDVAVVAIAEAFRNRSQAAAASAGALAGIVRAECWRRGIRVLVQPEATVRKEMLGRGYGPTERMKALALAWCERVGLFAVDHNAADAAVFWAWVRSELAHQRADFVGRTESRVDKSQPLLRGLSGGS